MYLGALVSGVILTFFRSLICNSRAWAMVNVVGHFMMFCNESAAKERKEHKENPEVMYCGFKYSPSEFLAFYRG
jgi:hypothetical protein